MVEEGRPLITVSDSTSCLHTICHARWSAGEDTNLREENVLFGKAVKELVEIRTAEVSDSPQTSKETATRQLLEVPFTDVLDRKTLVSTTYVMETIYSILTSIVVRRSNLSKNWVIKMWFSTSPLVSASSTSLMISVNHSHCFWLRVTQMKKT